MLIASNPLVEPGKTAALNLLPLTNANTNQDGSTYRLGVDGGESVSGKDLSFALKLVVTEAGSSGTNKATLALQHSPDNEVWFPLDSISSVTNQNGIFSKPVGGSTTMFRYVRAVLTLEGTCKATTKVVGASVGLIKATKV